MGVLMNSVAQSVNFVRPPGLTKDVMQVVSLKHRIQDPPEGVVQNQMDF